MILNRDNTDYLYSGSSPSVGQYTSSNMHKVVEELDIDFHVARFGLVVKCSTAKQLHGKCKKREDLQNR